MRENEIVAMPSANTTTEENNRRNEFEKELCKLINRYSLESRTNTADYVLAGYFMGCLTVYESTILERGRHNMSHEG